MVNGIDTKPLAATLVSAYTRAQAICDGVLVDVSDMAQEAGILFPTAITQAVHDKYVRVPDGVSWQDEQGRQWDILWMLRYGISIADDASEMLFSLYVQNDNSYPKPVKLKALLGPGDAGEPVITVMLPDENL